LRDTIIETTVIKSDHSSSISDEVHVVDAQEDESPEKRSDEQSLHISDANKTLDSIDKLWQ
jgi:hypothetical protein